MTGGLLALGVPRDDAAGRARDELTDPRYHRDEPSLVQRALDWVGDRLDAVLERVADASPGGDLGLVVLLLLLVVAVAAVVARTGGLRRTARSAPVLAGRERTADEHRADAEAAAAAGRWADAVRERLRAVARDLERRGVLDPQPGRTADELATQAGQVLPSAAADLRAASRVFDEVWYGRAEATAASYETVRRADEAARAARPAEVTA